MNTPIQQALEKHHLGDLSSALKLYEAALKSSPHDALAFYGIGFIKLTQGDISGLNFCKKSIIDLTHPDLDKALASESVLQTLIHLRQQDAAKKFLEECIANKIPINNQLHFVDYLRLPSHLAQSKFDQQMQQQLDRYIPMESNRYVYAIDIVGGCNLRCPTCPVANQDNIPKGLMSLELFDNILKKIRREQPNLNPDIWLFNWGEPLLHPEVDKFILTTRENGFTSMISSNLNHGGRLESLMKAAPDRMKISLSSLDQKIYSQTHARGKIGQVIENLHALAKFRDQYKSPTKIWIGHHLYKNTINEQTEIQALANSLGFGYAPSPAILAPIESVMELIDQQNNINKSIPIYQEISQQFLYDPLEIRKMNAVHRSGKKDCELRFNMTTIQYDGQVNLCCASTQILSQNPIKFLEHSFEDIENHKYDSSFCKKCMGLNLHLTIPDKA